MNKHQKMIGIIAVLFVFLLAACATPSTDKGNNNLPPIPTGGLPETIEDAAEEADESMDNVGVEMPPTPMDIEMVPMMFHMESEKFLDQYHGMLEGMIFSKAIDLEVVDIVDGSATPQFGYMFEAIVTVRNNGLVTSPQVKLDCDVAGGYDIGGWRWVGPLAPGESREYRTGFTSSSLAGNTYDYTCTVDADNTLLEFNKLNNSKTITIHPVMTNTDIAIVSVEEITRSAMIGYDHEFKVTIENLGPERSYKALMRCSYRKGLTTEEQIVYIGQMENPGDTVQVLCGFNGVPAGKHELLVEIDWGDQMEETNEKNNIATLTFAE